MSRRAELEQRVGRLAEIADILAAMKTLALLETRKFARFMVHQQQWVASLEDAAADFLAFHPAYRGRQTALTGDRALLLLIGSERGFCGDFNEVIVQALAALPPPWPRVLVLGRRLCGKLQDHPRAVAYLEGPAVAEEVRPVLDELMARLRQLSGWERLGVLAHDPDGGVATHVILPIAPPPAPSRAFPPRLNLAPEAFYAGLVEHYLVAQLPSLFYGSLYAENRRRLEHMERALGRIHSKIDDLGRRRNALRQEEITEEIEVILLSADNL